MTSESRNSDQPQPIITPVTSSDADIRRLESNEVALDELRRAEILVHTRYPDPGPAYPLGMGLFAGTYIASFALPTALMAVVFPSMAVTMGVLLRIYINRRGALPDSRKAPALLRREMVIMGLAYLAIAAAAAVLWVIAPWWVAAMVGAVASGSATEIYVRRFARVAEAVEAEAGIEPIAIA